MVRTIQAHGSGSGKGKGNGKGQGKGRGKGRGKGGGKGNKQANRDEEVEFDQIVAIHNKNGTVTAKVRPTGKGSDDSEDFFAVDLTATNAVFKASHLILAQEMLDVYISTAPLVGDNFLAMLEGFKTAYTNPNAASVSLYAIGIINEVVQNVKKEYTSLMDQGQEDEIMWALICEKVVMEEERMAHSSYDVYLPSDGRVFAFELEALKCAARGYKIYAERVALRKACMEKRKARYEDYLFEKELKRVEKQLAADVRHHSPALCDVSDDDDESDRDDRDEHMANEDVIERERMHDVVPRVLNPYGSHIA